MVQNEGPVRTQASPYLYNKREPQKPQYDRQSWIWWHDYGARYYRTLDQQDSITRAHYADAAVLVARRPVRAALAASASGLYLSMTGVS